MNSTASIPFIRLSLSDVGSNQLQGTHLIIINDACGPSELAQEQSSSSFILNYYRQFLLKLSGILKPILDSELDLKQSLLEAVSRVFSGVSAIFDYEIMRLRTYTKGLWVKKVKITLYSGHLNIDFRIK